MRNGKVVKEKIRKKNGENSVSLISLPVERLNGGRLQYRCSCQNESPFPI